MWMLYIKFLAEPAVLFFQGYFFKKKSPGKRTLLELKHPRAFSLEESGFTPKELELFLKKKFDVFFRDETPFFFKKKGVLFNKI